MNASNLHPVNLIAAGVLIAGTLIILLPQHAVSVISVTVAGVAAAVSIHLLVTNTKGLREGPWWRDMSPFTRARARTNPRNVPRDLERVRSMLGRTRHRGSNHAPLPFEVERALSRTIRIALDRERLNPFDPAQSELVRRTLSPLTWSLLHEDQGSEGQGRRQRMLQPDEKGVAEVVHQVLDDLDRLAAVGTPTTGPSASPPARPVTNQASRGAPTP